MELTEEQKIGLAKLKEPFEPNQINLLPKPYKKDSPSGKCAECGGPIEMGHSAVFFANAKRSNGAIHAIYSHLHGNADFKAAVKEALSDEAFRTFVKQALKN